MTALLFVDTNVLVYAIDAAARTRQAHLSPSVLDHPFDVTDDVSNISLLSDKTISVNERLIVALDVSSEREAKEIVSELGTSVEFYKLGLQMLMSGSYFETVSWLREQGKQVFADIKFFDVPRTVASSVEQLQGRGVKFATVHGNDEMLRSACAVKHDTKILAVTVLTSLDEQDMISLGFDTDIPRLVLSRARRALDLGCDGVISSGMESRELRQSLGQNFLVVVPGIRPGKNTGEDDQKRTVDIEEAFTNGADYIVVGRPILDAPDRHSAADAMQKRIRTLFATPQ